MHPERFALVAAASILYCACYFAYCFKRGGLKAALGAGFLCLLPAAAVALCYL